jgi:predicted RNase H-like HicB family nuclease
MVATCPTLQGFIAEARTEDELIKDVIEVMDLFREEGLLEKDQEYNIFLRYKKRIINDSEL